MCNTNLESFWEPKLGLDFVILFYSFCCGFPWVLIDMQWPHENKKIKHVEWNNKQVSNLSKLVCVGVKGLELGVKVKGSHKCRHESTQTLESSRGSAPKLWIFFSFKVAIHCFPCKSWTFSLVHWVNFEMNHSIMKEKMLLDPYNLFARIWT